jgi:ATP-dependent Clp protease ATP-binding subunit ClpC
MSLPPRIFELVNNEAVALGHDYIGTEHILLALAGCTGTPVALALSSHGVDRDSLKPIVQEIAPVGKALEPGRRPMTTVARDVIANAIKEARALRDQEVGPEHLLLAILRMKNGVAPQLQY